MTNLTDEATITTPAAASGVDTSEANARTHAEYRRRLAVVQQLMAQDDLDVVVSADSGGWLPPTGDGRYLTGFTFTNLGQMFPGLALIVGREGEPVLVMPGGPQGGFADWARATTSGVRIVDSAAVLIGVADGVRDMLPGGGRVALEQQFPDFEQLGGLLPTYQIVDARDADSTGARGPLSRARAVKSPVEIASLQAAQSAADAGMGAFRQAAVAGERHVVAQSAARDAAIAAGAEDALVIMNCGTEPWMWWHYQGDRRFPAGGLVSVEVNARIDGYTAQLARTWSMGEPDARAARVLDAGIASIEAMVGALHPGATGHDVWAAGAGAVRDAGIESWGRLGHGVGLSMDEGIAVVEGNESTLEVGTVLAVHSAAWDPEARYSGLVGEQYVIGGAGPELLSTTVPPRDAATWDEPEEGTT